MYNFTVMPLLVFMLLVFIITHVQSDQTDCGNFRCTFYRDDYCEEPAHGLHNLFAPPSDTARFGNAYSNGYHFVIEMNGHALAMNSGEATKCTQYVDYLCEKNETFLNLTAAQSVFPNQTITADHFANENVTFCTLIGHGPVNLEVDKVTRECTSGMTAQVMGCKEYSGGGGGGGGLNTSGDTGGGGEALYISGDELLGSCKKLPPQLLRGYYLSRDDKAFFSHSSSLQRDNATTPPHPFDTIRAVRCAASRRDAGRSLSLVLLMGVLCILLALLVL